MHVVDDDDFFFRLSWEFNRCQSPVFTYFWCPLTRRSKGLFRALGSLRLEQSVARLAPAAYKNSYWPKECGLSSWPNDCHETDKAKEQMLLRFKGCQFLGTYTTTLHTSSILNLSKIRTVLGKKSQIVTIVVISLLLLFHFSLVITK